MATAFAITGIHRSKLKHYRPSYHSELPPIYEDHVPGENSRRSNFKYTQDSDEYMYVPSFMQNGKLCKQSENSESFIHNYEQIDPSNLMQINALRPSLQTNQSDSMLHGIMSNRFQVKCTSLDINKQSDSDGVKENNTVKREKVGEKSFLRRCSSLYQGMSSTKDVKSITNTGDSTSEEYTKGTKSRKWPKLEPETLKNPHLWCPAEKKFKKRCFALCFVVLALVIGTFVIVSLDGWVFKAKGRGLVGTEKPILWRTAFSEPPEENFTDIRHTDNSQEANFTAIRLTEPDPL